MKFKKLIQNKERGIIIWPIQHDRMNMTIKFEQDQKDHTNKH